MARKHRKIRHTRRVGHSSEIGAFCVGIYVQNRAYGGPEEGGWWYATGYLADEPDLRAMRRTFRSERDAIEYANRLNDSVCAEINGEKPSYKHDLKSVCCEGHYRAEVHDDECPNEYPSERPYYS
jgi:hypothetical protein